MKTFTRTPEVYHTESFSDFREGIIVRGVDPKRAILVHIRPIFGVDPDLTKEEIAIKAAEYAAKKGWKKVIVNQHVLYEETLEIFNLSQWDDFVFDRISSGKFLCEIKEPPKYKSF